MKLSICILAIAATVGTAQAKDITITLNDDEQKALFQLIDAGVRAQGMNAVAAANYFMQKLQGAAAEPKKPEAEKPKDGK